MENKFVGWIILGISVINIAMVFLFRNALKTIIAGSCSLEHAISCPMYDAVNQQTYLALGFVGILVLVGFVLILSKPTEKVIVKKVMEKKPVKKYDLSDLKAEDKKVFNLIKESVAIFQADLIEKTEMSKQKVSRIVDRLEGRNLVERKRRGMTNVVVLKED
jgi:hypothetical protein